MEDIHIAQVGAWFPEIDDFHFFSDQNIYEYDFIVIESSSFIHALREGFERDIIEKVADLKKFIALKNIPIVFLCSEGGAFQTQFGNSNLTITGLMGLEATEVSSVGRKIEINPDSLFVDLMKRYSESLEYKLSFSGHPGTSIGKAKAKSNSIGFYTRDFVFLPAFEEDCDIDDDAFLNDLYEICCLIRRGDDAVQVPEWSNNYLLPGEKEEKDRLDNIKNEIKNLQDAQKESELRLSNFLPLKQLWTSSGATLEKAVRDVFIELGFIMLPSEERRDDIIMEINGQIVIAEIKGQNKSAAEKNAAQLEKWLSTYISNHEEGNPKGLLIVNTFREQPLVDRTQASFPNQMLGYSTARNHCLITTLQLCVLLLFCRSNPKEREIVIEKLLSTTGCFEGFDNWSEFIYVKNSSKQEKAPKKSISKKS